MSQHKDGFEAKADESLLGKVPNMIRGYLSDYRMVPLETEPFQHCVCCSPNIRNAYKKDGLKFLKMVMDDNSVLEKVSGLESMKTELDAGADLDIDFPDDEDEDGFTAL